MFFKQKRDIQSLKVKSYVALEIRRATDRNAENVQLTKTILGRKTKQGSVSEKTLNVNSSNNNGTVTYYIQHHDISLHCTAFSSRDAPPYVTTRTTEIPVNQSSRQT